MGEGILEVRDDGLKEMSSGAGVAVEEKALDWVEVEPEEVEVGEREALLRRVAARSDGAAVEDGEGLCGGRHGLEEVGKVEFVRSEKSGDINNGIMQ